MSMSITWFMKERLLIFMFAGENGNLDPDEEALATCWQAFVARSVYERFGFWKGTVVMLAFDDYDHQKMFFIDQEEVVKEVIQRRHTEKVTRKTMSGPPMFQDSR